MDDGRSLLAALGDVYSVLVEVSFIVKFVKLSTIATGWLSMHMALCGVFSFSWLLKISFYVLVMLKRR